MAKFLITGISGTGKSTVAEQLNKIGIKAIDIDSIDGMCHWEDEFGNGIEYVTGAGKDWLDKNNEKNFILGGGITSRQRDALKKALANEKNIKSQISDFGDDVGLYGALAITKMQSGVN
jgi:gluconate kinase